MKKIINYLPLMLLSFVLVSCGFPVRYTQIRGNGNTQTESREVAGFNAVELSGIGRLVITQAEQESLEISAEENILPYLRSDVSSGILKLSVDDFVSILPKEEITYFLTVKNLQDIKTSGLGDLEIAKLQTGRLTIEISGSGKATIGALVADLLKIEISGLGDVEISGEVDEQRVQLSGAGSFKAGDLKSNMAQLEISGTGEAVLWVLENLDAEISGAGNVRFYGSPDVQSEISGLGNISSMGEK